MTETRLTFCRICEQACGLEATLDDGRITKIEPDKAHPYSWRDFCVKGAKAHEMAYHPRRITMPMKRVGDRYVPATYEEAIADISARLKKIIDEHGPNAVGGYGGNPASFGFDAPTFMTGLMKAIGSHNWYWVVSVDTNAMHAVAEMMHGSPWLFSSIDVDACRCFLLVGTNPADSTNCWGGHAPEGWRRVLEAQQKGASVIVVDPRRTPTAQKADLHIAIKPGEDWAFLLGVVKVVIGNGWLHAEDCKRARGLDIVKQLVAGVTLADLAARCDVPVAQIEEVARRFAQAPAAHCVTRTGPGLSRNGSLAEWLSNVLNLITGRYEKPGGRVFGPGIYDLIAATESMFKPNTTPSRVRKLRPIADGHSLAELPDEINTPGEGQIKALFIQAGNPVVMGPAGAALDAALAKLDLLVAIDLVQRESHRHAHWLIPGVHWLERTEVNPLTTSLHDKPFVQMAHAVIDRPPGVRPEWEFLADLALALDKPLFGLPAFNRVIRASRWLARTSGIEKLAFDPSWMAWAIVKGGKRVKWKDIVRSPRGMFYGEKTYGHLWDALRTPDKLVDLAPAPLVELLQRRLGEKPAAQTDYPLQLISRRRVQNMNSWLADTAGITIKPFSGDAVEINADDAARLGIADGQTVRVVSRVASIEARALVSDRIRPGVIVIEQGWGSRLYDPTGKEPPLQHGINRNLLVPNDELDPVSCVPAMNGTAVRVEALAA